MRHHDIPGTVLFDGDQAQKGLALNRRHRSRVLEDTPSVRGMINAVKHLVEIVEDK